MKIISWNCRGLRRPSTISQLKKELRLHLSDSVFLSETKNKKVFVQVVCKKNKEFNKMENCGSYRSKGRTVFGELR